MVKNHLSRLVAPKGWPIKRKGIKFITRPNAGQHNLKECITIIVVLKEILKYAKETREVKKIVREGKVMVNGIVRKDYKFSLGSMDNISFPDLKENYLILRVKKGKFRLIKEKEAETQICKIKNKRIIKKGVIQLNFSNGNNMLVENNEYKTGDSVVVNLKDKKIIKHLILEKGAKIYIDGGKRLGMVGELISFKKMKEGKENIIFKVNGEKYETAKEYSFVIGDLKIENE